MKKNPQLLIIPIFLLMFVHLILVIGRVGFGMDELITGWGIPIFNLFLLVVILLLSSNNKIPKDIMKLLKIGLIGSLTGSISQHLVWRSELPFYLDDFFSATIGWFLVFPLIVIAVSILRWLFDKSIKPKLNLIESAFALFIAFTLFTIYSSLYILIMATDTVEDCVHHGDSESRDQCILELGDGSDCNLIEDESIREDCYHKHDCNCGSKSIGVDYSEKYELL